jgi:hypothetical protein
VIITVVSTTQVAETVIVAVITAVAVVVPQWTAGD